MINKLSQILNGGVHLDLVFPFVLGPLFLELKLRALCMEEVVDEINLNFIDVQNIWLIAVGGIVSDVAVNYSIVGGGNL